MAESIPTAKRVIDWEAIEREYRVGVRSMADIAGEFGVTAAAICKKAKREEWDRDLSARIRAKAEALVNAAAVNEGVNADRALTERNIVASTAQIQAAKLIEHRTDIPRYQSICKSLLAELETCGEDLAKRASILKTLSDTLKTLIGLERQAFGIADTADGDKQPKESQQKYSDTEIARRIAFALTMGLRANSAAPIAPIA